MPGKSKSGMATLVASEVNVNAGPYHFQSNNMYCRLCLAAKSIFSKASFVVWVITRIILPGFTQLTSFMFEGAFKLSSKSLFTIKSPGFSATIITRHGVATGDIRSAGVYMEVTMVFGFLVLSLNFVRA